MSLVKDEDATSSWESAVDMDAAMMAASRMPDRNGGKKRLARWMKTVAWRPSGRSSPATIIRPRYAMMREAAREMVTQMMAMVADFLISDGLRMAMKRTRMWGMPK